MRIIIIIYQSSNEATKKEIHFDKQRYIFFLILLICNFRALNPFFEGLWYPGYPEDKHCYR